MNPYDFVRIDWESGIERAPARPHDRLDGLSGALSGTIEALTPIFLPAAGADTAARVSDAARRFARNGRGQAIVPGSSLKGLIRSLVETLGPGCWSLFGGGYEIQNGRPTVDYQTKLPADFKKCQREGALCVACRVFGWLASSQRHLGQVSFEDAECIVERPHEPVYTPIFVGPKPRHAAWYLANDRVAGRKFYFHQPEIRTVNGLETTRDGKPLNSRLAPLAAGSRFAFKARFQNLDAAWEWPLLLYALLLEEGVRHKIGYAKPAGFGSIAIALDEIRLIEDPAARYRGGAGARVLRGAELTAYLGEQIASVRTATARDTRQDLRRIWGWPAVDLDYQYPTQQWFRDHPDAPIAATRDA